MNHLGTPPLKINVEPDALHRGQLVGAGVAESGESLPLNFGTTAVNWGDASLDFSDTTYTP